MLPHPAVPHPPALPLFARHHLSRRVLDLRACARLSARPVLLLLFWAGCGLGPALAAPEPATRPAVSGATGMRLTGNVPLPQPRPEDLGEEETEEREEDAPVIAPLPIYPPMYSAPDRKSPAPSFGEPPPPGTAPTRSAPFPGVAGTESEKAAPGELPAMCAALVAQNRIAAAPAHAVATRPGCALPSPVQLSGVRMKDGTMVTFAPAAILRCEAAAHIAHWVREDLGPAVAALGSRMETLKVAASYDCRPRNRIVGAKMSEHGQGIAMDVGGFVLEDKRVLDVKANGLPFSLQAAMKASACMNFSTVLGPGSDGYHEDHIHVDMAIRRLDIKLCRWGLKPQGAPMASPAAPVSLGAAVRNADTRDVQAPPAAAAPQAEEEEATAAEEASEEAVPAPPARPATAAKPAPKPAAKPAAKPASTPPKPAPKPTAKSTTADGTRGDPKELMWGPSAGGGIYAPR